MADVGIYAYALTRDAAGGGPSRDDLTGVLGLDDQPLTLVTHGGLAAVVSEVDLSEFGEDALPGHLEDLTWLGGVATGHDRVVRAVADLAPAAPLRLATIFVTEHGLLDRLTQWADPAHRALDRLEGAREWSVKVYVDEPDAARPDGLGAAAETETGRGAGAAYLRRRREAGEHRDRAAQRGQEVADGVHQRLGAVCTAGRRLAAQDRRLTGHTGEMVLNGAYLVDDDRLDEFQAAVADLGHEHSVRMEVGGPWAPYSFATLEDV